MNVLIPTDFSTCARSAFDHACSLAKKFDAPLYIYHAADIPANWEELTITERHADAEHQKIVDDAMQGLKRLQRDAIAVGLSAQIHISALPFLDGLAKVVEDEQIDLVVIGSHGKNQKTDASWGRQTQRVAREIDRKVLVVKSSEPPLAFATVMFATNLDRKDRKVFKEFLAFLDQFDIDRIHIVAIDTHDYFSQPSLLMTSALEEFKTLVGRHECETHFFRSSSVEGGIRKFSEKYKVDLIAMANSHKSRILRFIQGGKLESLVASTELPVLSIPS